MRSVQVNQRTNKAFSTFRTFLATCHLYFSGSASSGGLLVARCQDEDFVFFGIQCPAAEGTMGTMSKVMKFIKGTRRGTRPGLDGRCYYGILLLVTCDKKKFHVRSINLQKLARHLTLVESSRKGVPALIPIPALAVTDPWPFDKFTWNEALRRLQTFILLGGQSVQRFDGQSISISPSTLHYWRTRSYEVGCPLKFDLPPYQTRFPSPASIEFTALGPLCQSKAF
eukprot:Gregarina_sp_Poly_1__1719@NODE_1444_length_4133_cov_160_835957_g144_i1_p1_GENE_NODE_1444_length_4133_cov_160_835957_g144_i1NODE_1444_length_4133_cov_160_835957_g144_i1_p1_ORF_typecomplete_len226_score29_61_NODE_1444_length_4133_cov_160_835957_g144_i123713048